jgi:hypothetical protein
VTDPPALADSDATAALARLPTSALGIPGLDADPAWRLAAAFLLSYRGHTRRAYFADIRAWYGWCAGIDLPPLAAQRHHVDRWIAEQLEHPAADVYLSQRGPQRVVSSRMPSLHPHNRRPTPLAIQSLAPDLGRMSLNPRI